eukprot:1731345-Rhodomonas_salina.1
MTLRWKAARRSRWRGRSIRLLPQREERRGRQPQADEMTGLRKRSRASKRLARRRRSLRRRRSRGRWSGRS